LLIVSAVQFYLYLQGLLLEQYGVTCI